MQYIIIKYVIVIFIWLIYNISKAILEGGFLLIKNNPIIPMKGVCDPHIHIFNDRAYLYASHDMSPDNTIWLIWSSADLMSWELEGTVHPEDMYIGKSTGCWAVDAAAR